MKLAKRCSHLMFVILILLVVSSFTSFVPSIVTLAIYIVGIIVAFFEMKSFVINKSLLLFLLFVLISFLYVFVLGIGHFYEIRNIALSYTTIFMCLSVSPILDTLSKKQISLLLIILLACIVESLIATIVIEHYFPLVVRQLGFGVEENDNMAMQQANTFFKYGMASYLTLHAWVVIPPLCILYLIKTKSLKLKLLCLSISVISLYCLYVTAVTTSFLLAVFFSVSILVFYVSKEKKLRFYLYLFMGMIFVFLSGVIISSFMFLIIEGNHILVDKFMDIISTIQTGKFQGQLGGRLELYNLSIMAFFSNPIFGGALNSEVGEHSLVLDMLGFYGVFSLLLFFSWYHSMGILRKTINSKDNFYLKLCLFPIVFLAIFKGTIFLPYYFVATLFLVKLIFLNLKFSKLV